MYWIFIEYLEQYIYCYRLHIKICAWVAKLGLTTEFQETCIALLNTWVQFGVGLTHNTCLVSRSQRSNCEHCWLVFLRHGTHWALYVPSVADSSPERCHEDRVGSAGYTCSRECPPELIASLLFSFACFSLLATSVLFRIYFWVYFLCSAITPGGGR